MTTDTPEEITSTNLEYEDDGHPDAGVCFSVICPLCGDKIHLATQQWDDDTTCSCPRRWNLSITATGTRVDE